MNKDDGLAVRRVGGVDLLRLMIGNGLMGDESGDLIVEGFMLESLTGQLVGTFVHDFA